MQSELFSSPSFEPFIFGVASIVGLLLIWKVIRYLYYWREASKYSASLYDVPVDDSQYESAIEIAKGYKKRLLFQKGINPRWVEPLVVEVPALIKEIARVYYPDSSDPVMAPGMSQFARAVQLIAGDISNFLEDTWIGRRIDVSGTTARKITSGVNKWRQNRWLKGFFKIYKKVRPVAQAVKAKSVFMWGPLIARNAGVRYLQPKIIDIVAWRSIQLYSGKLGKSSLNVQPTAEMDTVGGATDQKERAGGGV